MSDQPTNDPTAPSDVPPTPPPAWSGSAPVPPAPAAPEVPAPPAYQPPPAAYQPPVAPVPPAYPPQGYAAAPAPGVMPLSPAESRQWAMLAHVGGIILGFVGPLIVMLVFGPRDAFTRDQAVESLNFQITLLIGYIVGTILTAIIIAPVGLLVWVAGLVFAIMGALAANKGQTYRYPFALRLVK
jgi:uncharacterized Tic20 family protein